MINEIIRTFSNKIKIISLQYKYLHWSKTWNILYKVFFQIEISRIADFVFEWLNKIVYRNLNRPINIHVCILIDIICTSMLRTWYYLGYHLYAARAKSRGNSLAIKQTGVSAWRFFGWNDRSAVISITNFCM